MKKYVLLYLSGSIIYPLLELTWRSSTHYSMSIAGGICFVLINFICCEKHGHRHVFHRCAIGSGLITAVELIVGIIFNIYLAMNVWDYSQLPLNFWGQICLPFSIIWFILCIPAMYICNKISFFAGRNAASKS